MRRAWAASLATLSTAGLSLSPVSASDDAAMTPSPLVADADGASESAPLPGAIVVTAPGGSFDIDDAHTLSRADILLGGRPDLLASLTRSIAGVSLQDAQGNPWQPNLVYRGFTASPLQGQAQGLAAYLDGARFNQPFGDTIGFDLIPEAALQSVALRDASPALGLNALGGTLVLETATGRSAPGMDAALSIGSFGEREVSLSAGGTAGDFSYFAAFQSRRETGWRDFSPSRLVNGYLDLGYDTQTAGLHVKLIGADTDLTGNGVAPVELLAARRAAVLSWPDRSTSRYGRISLHPWVALGEETRIEATLYRQRLRARSVNGDIADIEDCEEPADAGLLCLESDDDDEASELTDANGAPIPELLDDGAYGVLNRGALHSRSMGVLAQVIDERTLGAGTNRLALGMSIDTGTSDFASSTELGAFTPLRSVEGLGPQIIQADGAIAPVSLTARTRYLGLFVAESLPLGADLTAEIGLRYNHARVRMRDRIGTALNGDHRFDKLNPGIELDWQVSPALTLRAGYAQTNRVPTPAELSCADEEAPCSLANFFVADPPLKQVVAHGWELGASGKGGSAGWHWNWQLSAWRTRNRDDIVHVASAIRGRAYFRNIERTRRQGIEASFAANTATTRISASYAFTDATFGAPVTLSSPSNPQASDAGTIEVAKGDAIPGIPRHSATLSIDHGIVLAGHRLDLGGDLVARSGQRLVGDEAGLTPKLPGYVLVNLRANMQLGGAISLFGEVRNLFDRDFATFGTFAEIDEVALAEAPDASDPRAYGPGAPRRWTLGLRAQF